MVSPRVLRVANLGLQVPQAPHQLAYTPYGNDRIRIHLEYPARKMLYPFQGRYAGRTYWRNRPPSVRVLHRQIPDASTAAGVTGEIDTRRVDPVAFDYIIQ